MTVRNNPTAHHGPLLPEEFSLIERAKSGDAEAFAKLYDAYVERVSRYVYFRISEDYDVEDLVSQVFLKAWENLSHYKAGNSLFAAWLYTIAKNLVIDHYRTRKDTLPLEEILALASETEMPDEEVQTRFDLAALRNALQVLPYDQQQALILKYIAGVPNESIARLLNKQEGTVRGLQMRGLQTLAKHMKEKEVV